MSLRALRREMKALGSPEKAAHAMRFFKTGPGQYGEGDRFLGLRVPETRALVKAYDDTLSDSDLDTLLDSPIHEERLFALLSLVRRYDSAPKGSSARTHIHKYYLQKLDRINNWDLVDTSAPYIPGQHLLDNGSNIAPLHKLAKSPKLWDRRIGIVATYAFIRTGELAPTFTIADILLNDTHDLIHKASGWMLREAGKRDLTALEQWLTPRCKQMPRTMLRYAIEKMTPAQRRAWLAGKPA